MLLVSMSAGARVTGSTTFALTGSLTLAWQGDHSLGCAAAGVCGVTGSLEMIPSSANGGSSSGRGAALELIDPYAAARVSELSAGGAGGTACADPVPVDFTFVLRHAADGALQARIGSGFFVELPSAGRCAGPTAADLLRLALPARGLGTHRYDLSGRTTFAAGPFIVTAISTMRTVVLHGSGVTISGGSGSSTGTGTSVSITAGTKPVPIPREVLQEYAHVVYRAEASSGELTTQFSGLPAPVCAPLGACGTSGTLSGALSAGGAGGTISFYGTRIVKHRVGARAALADLRAGRLEIYASPYPLAVHDAVSELLQRPDGTTCTDQTDTKLVVGAPFVPPRRGVVLSLGFNGPFGLGSFDPLRTRCPGPSSTDVLGSSAMATATVPGRAPGAGQMTLTFRHPGAFTSSGYSGMRGGAATISLVLVRAGGGTNRVPEGTVTP
jgi:hypothetical protein